MHARLSKIEKIKHIIPLIPVYFIVITVTSAFTKFILYNYNPNTNTYEESFNTIFSIFIKPVLMLAFYICFTMTVINHIKCILTNPGHVSLDYINKYRSSPVDQCKKCNIPRPERAKHCKTCNTCILKFDHHCPWIANCVGIYNQKNFLQFLFFATMGDFIAFVCFLPKLLDINLKVKSNSKDISTILYLMSDKLFLLLATLLSVAMVIAIGFLFTVQLGLILNNITTVETKVLEGKNSKYYDINKLNSFKIVMGLTWKDWISPKFEVNKVNNGYNYGKFTDLLNHGKNYSNINYSHYSHYTSLSTSDEIGYAYDLTDDNTKSSSPSQSNINNKSEDDITSNQV